MKTRILLVLSIFFVCVGVALSFQNCGWSFEANSDDVSLNVLGDFGEVASGDFYFKNGGGNTPSYTITFKYADGTESETCIELDPGELVGYPFSDEEEVAEIIISVPTGSMGWGTVTFS